MSQLLPIISTTIYSFVYAIYFYVRTGVRLSVVRRIFKDLSNRYLTPNKPGEVVTFNQVIEIVTSLPRMQITLWFRGHSTVLWVDRDKLTVTQANAESGSPLWASESFPVLDLIKHLAKEGINIPYNNDGVSYYAMPEEFQ